MTAAGMNSSATSGASGATESIMRASSGQPARNMGDASSTRRVCPTTIQPCPARSESGPAQRRHATTERVTNARATDAVKDTMIVFRSTTWIASSGMASGLAGAPSRWRTTASSIGRTASTRPTPTSVRRGRESGREVSRIGMTEKLASAPGIHGRSARWARRPTAGESSGIARRRTVSTHERPAPIDCTERIAPTSRAPRLTMMPATPPQTIA